MRRLFEKIDQRGWLMIETAISIPIISMLLVTTSIIFWQGWRFYRNEVADWILHEEISQAMNNMTQQIPQAENGSIKIQSGGIYDRIDLKIGRIKSSSKSGVTYEHESRKLSYFVESNPEHQMQLYSNSSSDPITGMNILHGQVVVTKFKCRLKREDLIRIELECRSLLTNHRLEFSTEIFLPNMQHN